MDPDPNSMYLQLDPQHVLQTVDMKKRLLIYNCNTYLSTFILRNLKDLDQILLLFHLNIISIYFTKICFLLDTVL